MTQLTNLPNEIVAMIAESLLPGDIENFSVTSKTIQSQSEPSLRKHHEMKRKYKNRLCTTKDASLSDLLYDIVVQPTVALYVEHLIIEGWYGCWFDALEVSHTRYPEEKMASMEEAVTAFVPSDQVPAWVTAIERGDEDPVLALLLVQLSNVTTLTLEPMGITSRRFFHTLISIPETPGGPLLSNLTTLEIHGPWSLPRGRHRDWQAINVFARLPSLQSIIAGTIYIVGSGEDGHYALPPRSSNVSTLIIEKSYINAKLLCKLLQGFKSLKQLSFEDINRAPRPIGTLQIFTVLLTEAKTSLEYLKLLMPEDAEMKDNMGRLREFENLREIHMNLGSLENTEHSSRGYLAQMLPASVEKVRLDEWLYHSLETIQDLVFTAVEDKEEHFPNLKELHLRTYLFEVFMRREDPRDQDAIGRMQAKCENAGFQLVID